MEIRRAQPDDAEALGRFHVEAWRAAYRGIIPDEKLDRLNPALRAERFRASLVRKREGTHVIEEGGQLLGFLTLGACRDEDADGAGEIWGICEAMGYRPDGRRKEHPPGAAQYVVSYEKHVEST